MMSKVRANVQWITSTNTYSKLILRKEINKLYLNTVLKIFIRQYRTRAGNHCNCCFIIIFENVLEYVLFRSDFFLSYLEWIIFSQQLDDGRLNPSKTPCFWREIVAAANSLRPRKQTNYADLKKTKAAFLYEAVQLLLTNIFTLIFDRV